MNTSLGQQADFDAVLRDKLQATIEALLADNARPSWQDVRAALSAVDGVTVSAIARTDDQVSFDLQVADNKSSLQKLVDGQTAEDAGFAAAANALPELNLQAMTQWMLQIDILREATVSPLEAFEVTFEQVDHSARIDTTNLGFAASVGVLGVTASGSANLNATLSAAVNSGQPITAAELLESSTDELVSTSESGNFDLALTLDAALGGQTFTAGLALPSVAVFGGQSQLQPSNFDALQDFVNVSPDGLAGGLSQLAGWLGDFGIEKLTGDVPLADATRYADVINLRSAFENKIVSLLKNEEGQLLFATLQEFEALSPLISNVNYNAANQELTFDVQFDEAPIDPLLADLSFDFEIGDFVGLSSDAMLTLSSNVEGTMRLGIDMSPLGRRAGGATDSADHVARRHQRRHGCDGRGGRIGRRRRDHVAGRDRLASQF